MANLKQKRKQRQNTGRNLHPVLAAGKLRLGTFQVCCTLCWEILYQDGYCVKTDKTGEPLESEIKRVFSYPEFHLERFCPCCGKSEFNTNYIFEPIASGDKDDEDDLPF